MDFDPKRHFYPWLPFFTLLRKEILRFWRVSTQTLIAPIVTAGLYLLVFGATLGDRLSIVEGFSYAQFVIPGLIMMGVINNSFANTSSSLFMSRYLGGIVDLLVTPVSPPQFIMAYTLAAMLRGLLVGSVVWIISTMFATLPWESPFLGILMAMLASFMFAQFGLIAAIYAQSFDTISMYTSFLIMPLIFLGGVFYPISILPDPWGKFSHLNPLFYLIDGFRHALIGFGDTSYLVAFGFSGVLAVILFIWAAWLIGKGHRLRG